MSAHIASLVDIVFSWSLSDILNSKLYETKVKKIPKTFESIHHYLNSFTDPLIEEVHENVCSSMKNVKHAPVRAISNIEQAKAYSMIYDVKFEPEDNSGKEFKIQSGDLILLSGTRNVCIDELGRFRRPIVLAVVMNKKVRTSAYITQKRRGNLYAVVLMNLTTAIRTWDALKQETQGKSLDIIRSVLDAGSAAGDECSSENCSPQQLEQIIGEDLYPELQSHSLNESQKNAVLDSILTSTCSHKNSVKLIWGPPGTGKTKTIASLLWSLLNMKCRTITCAPTNTAVVEVVIRLLKLARESNRSNSYWLGDIVLLGDEERLRLQNYQEISDVFLDYRVSKLGKCFSKWENLLNSMVNLLEDPIATFLVYQEKMKRNEQDEANEEENIMRNAQDKANKEKHITRNEAERSETFSKDKKKSRFKKGADALGQNDESNERYGECIRNEDILSLREYVSRNFNRIYHDLRLCIGGLCNNVPSSIISEAAKDMNTVLGLLECIKTFLCSSTLRDEEMTKIFVPCEQFTSATDEEHPPSATILNKQRKECLKTMHSLRSKFSVPDVRDESLIREFCLQNASLIFSTASSSCNMNLKNMKPLKMLVVDEAAQLKECELLIPLRLPGIQHAILIGDDCQLPSILKSTISWEADFGRSLFERLVSFGQRKHLLNIQYRMNPSISLFPNKQFYKNQILDGANVRETNYKINLLEGAMYGPYSFINVASGNEMPNKLIRKNMVEVAVVSKIVARLYEASITTGKRVSIGVITPYNAQVFAIQEKLGDKYGKSDNFSVRVRSFDGFQGGEEDVIIISTVRSNQNGSLGFLTSLQRTNVALTRARYCLWIVGNGQTLTQKDSIWKNLIHDAESRGCYFNANEDNSLAEVIIHCMVDSGQLENLLTTKSLFFREKKWKVIFEEEFFGSLKNVREVHAKKKVFSLLNKLSNGWRDPTKECDLEVADVSTSWLLKFYEVDKQHILVWSVDLLKENLQCIQVLKVWKISTCFEIPTLAKGLDHFFKKYTTEDINRLEFKRLEGDFELPMCWEITPEEDPKSNSKTVSARAGLASLHLE